MAHHAGGGREDQTVWSCFLTRNFHDRRSQEERRMETIICICISVQVYRRERNQKHVYTFMYMYSVYSVFRYIWADIWEVCVQRDVWKRYIFIQPETEITVERSETQRCSMHPLCLQARTAFCRAARHVLLKAMVRHRMHQHMHGTHTAQTHAGEHPAGERT